MIVIVIAFVIAFVVMFYDSADEAPLDISLDEDRVEQVDVAVDWGKYNYDYVDEGVKGVLSSMIRGKRVAFYLPPTGYINVSSGSEFGVAYALNNPNPSGENYFVFNWSVDDSVVESCGVSINEAQGWIERGWTSWGKIGEGWVDHMTVFEEKMSNDFDKMKGVYVK